MRPRVRPQLPSEMHTVGCLRRRWPHWHAKSLFARHSSSTCIEADKDVLKIKRDAHIERLEKYYPPSLVQSILSSEAMVTPKMWLARKPARVNLAPIYAEDFALRDPFYDLPVNNDDWHDKSKPRQPIPPHLPPGMLQEREEYYFKGTAGLNVTQLSQLTRFTPEFIRSLGTRFLVVRRVSNMTRKGKQSSLSVLAAVGDGNGHVGIGEGRHPEDTALASDKAYWNAIKNLVYIPRYENRTIFGSISSKFHSVLINLRPGAPGSGLRVNHVIYEICKLAGIHDLVGNVYRSRNPTNVAKGALEALSSHQSILEDVAVRRGKKIVDVTQAYYKF